MADEKTDAAIKTLGLDMETVFVPFSKSRNAKDKHPSLNWRVTIRRNGRDVLTTDYMQGCGHCPAYKAGIKAMGGRSSIMRDSAIRYECENGKSATPAMTARGGDNGDAI